MDGWHAQQISTLESNVSSLSINFYEIKSLKRFSCNTRWQRQGHWSGSDLFLSVVR